MLVLLVVLGGVAALVPMPTWLALLISVPIGLFGALLSVMGALAAYWDSHMNASHDGIMGLVCGLLMVASSVVVFFRRAKLD